MAAKVAMPAVESSVSSSIETRVVTSGITSGMTGVMMMAWGSRGVDGIWNVKN
jgi:hypothetical protein